MPSPPYTFTDGTPALAAQVNANFALFLDCLNATGGTVSGAITPDAGNTRDLGSSSLYFRVVYSKSFKVLDSDNSHTLELLTSSNLTANRTFTIVPGDANRTLTLAGDATISGTQSGTNTGDQSCFGTVAVSGQSDVVADQANDTLTLVAGTGITLTTSAGGDSVTVTNSSPGTTISGTDNKLVRVDGTTSLQSSAVTVDDSGNMSGVAGLSFNYSNNMTWNSKSIDTAYQAGSDGFFVVWADGVTSGGIGSVSIVSDSNSSPTTVRGKASLSNDHATITIPVKKGDYYKAISTTSSGTIVWSLLWAPFGLTA